MSVNPQARCLVDTNILVYAFDRTAGRKWEIAKQLLRDCWENETGCLSIQVLQEFYVIVTRKIAKPVEHHIARQLVADLSQWRVHAPEANDVLQAIDLQERHQLSFWDAMILQSATRLECKQLVSEDFRHGQIYGSVAGINPFAEDK